MKKCHCERNRDQPSNDLLMLVKGRRESLISMTTSVRVSREGSIRVNFIMCPGYHDGGAGSRGNGMWVRDAIHPASNLSLNAQTCSEEDKLISE